MAVPVLEGEVLAGKYRIERVLGQGGMGVVVAARHVELDERVALKFLLPEAVQEPEAVARFLKEARAAVRIKNEHVARVHDVGQLENGAPYIVMEYLDGSDLGAVLRSRGPLPVEDAVDYVAQTCEAIADAHALGIVHRDLKPSNLMLVRRSDGSDCIKVLDFGISKNTTSGGTGSINATRTAMVLGSPAYMSPEQMMSPRSVDGRSDIWALGAILYELLTGRLAFEAETMQAIGILVATGEPIALRAHRPDVPAGLEAAFARCLAKNRDDRFPNVGALAAALAPFAPERARLPIARALRIAGGESDAESGRRVPPSSAPLAPPVSSAPALGLRPDPASGAPWTRTQTAGPTAGWNPAAIAEARPPTRLRKGLLVLFGAVVAAAAVVAAIALRGGAGTAGLISRPPAGGASAKADVPRSAETQAPLHPAPPEAPAEALPSRADPPDAGSASLGDAAPARAPRDSAKLPVRPAPGAPPNPMQKRSAYEDM